MQNQKIFAFRLAIQQKSGNKPWQPRDGPTVAGCSGLYARADSRQYGRDRGVYC